MQYLVTVVGMFVGVIIGFFVAWNALERRYATTSTDHAQSAQIRELERRLHQKDCDYLDELTALKRDMLATQEGQLKEAVAEARSSQREVYESQLQSFTVNISPWVEVRELGTAWFKRYRERSGYQYQLMVNGIPAFDPHVMTLHDEERKSVDEKALLETATQAATLVLDTYSAASQIFKMAAPVVRKLGKQGDA